MIYKIARRIFSILYLKKFRKSGRNISFDPISSNFSYHNIILGDNVFIGKNAHFSSSHSNIIIGSDVMFGPNVNIYGGDHIYNIIGQPMNMNKKSAGHQDKNIIIEDDVWVGGCSILLSGVTVGRGAIIGAGSVVTKNIIPYSINAGNPCKLIKMRFTSDQIIEHEQKINNLKC